ncbi:MAG: twin-arginine translocase TatA/TatE family subunit [Alphaproteobacteria bacterium]|nr:twin-arginine translocase TatA/TatE family subunit [Alphaproteobacteria bacterium]
MFDVGWSEIFLIAIVAILAIGPKELPEVMRLMGRVSRRLYYVRFALSQQFENMMKEAGMDDIRKQVNFEEKDFDERSADEEEEDLTTKSTKDTKNEI